MFVLGGLRDWPRIYLEQLRPRLSEEAQAIRDKRMHSFEPAGVGLYSTGLPD